MQKYETQNNVFGDLVKTYRKKKKLSKSKVSRRLQLHTVYVDRIQLYRMKTGQMIIKDIE